MVVCQQCNLQRGMAVHQQYSPQTILAVALQYREKDGLIQQLYRQYWPQQCNIRRGMAIYYIYSSYYKGGHPSLYVVLLLRPLQCRVYTEYAMYDSVQSILHFAYMQCNAKYYALNRIGKSYIAYLYSLYRLYYTGCRSNTIYREGWPYMAYMQQRWINV